MRVGILAGGVGSRLSEVTSSRPKPMVEIGGRPMLWHIMMLYSQFGHRDFVIALGYLGGYIKRYFADYCALDSDLTIDLKAGRVEKHQDHSYDWRVQLIDTGQETQTGGRIKRLAPYFGNETFMLTWGDGVSTVDFDDLLEFHRRHGKLATVTAVRPQARFGRLEIEDQQVVSFQEKPQMHEGWINGAFFVLEPGIFDYIDGDMTHFEKEPLENIARDGQLMAYKHDGFWQCMDTLRDKVRLEQMWAANEAPWKTWA